MIDHSYIGDWNPYDDDLRWLIDNGIPVLWHIRYEDMKGNVDTRHTERTWHPVKDFKDLERVHFKYNRKIDRFSYVEVAWRIPNEKYPLIDARYVQKDREFWEMVHEKAEEARLMNMYARRRGQFDMTAECIEGFVYDTQLAPERRFE